jgi:hypothetical protein
MANQRVGTTLTSVKTSIISSSDVGSEKLMLARRWPYLRNEDIIINNTVESAYLSVTHKYLVDGIRKARFAFKFVVRSNELMKKSRQNSEYSMLLV